MTKRIVTAALAAALSLGALPLMAQDAPPPPRGPLANFDVLDANKDGRVTKEEIAAARKAAVEGLDANKDGVLTAEEITTFRMAREGDRVREDVARLMAERDVNGDGRLSAAELAGGPGFGPGFGPGIPDRHFARIDTDGDGAISREEADAARKKMEDGPRGHGPKHGKDGPGRPHGPDRDDD